jgi:hypothetical protein
MIKLKSTVIYQTKYAAVKARDIGGDYRYDVWVWNVWKCKWTRKSQHACGFTVIAPACQTADIYSLEIINMLRDNQLPPEPIK